MMQRRRMLLGYCAPLTGNSFRTDLASGLRRAAAEGGAQLLVIDNSQDDADILQNQYYPGLSTIPGESIGLLDLCNVVPCAGGTLIVPYLDRSASGSSARTSRGS